MGPAWPGERPDWAVTADRESEQEVEVQAAGERFELKENACSVPTWITNVQGYFRTFSNTFKSQASA